MTKLYYGAKKFFGDAKLIIAGVALGTGLFMSGCEKEVVAPDGTTVTVTVDDPSHGTVTITPTTQTPDVTTQTPDTTTVDPDTTTQTPDTVETVEEELPSIVLYDKNGDLYKPQDVKLDEIYKRIDYANEKYDWKSDWDRDRFVGLLLMENAYYMQDEDIKTVYYDYLDNFGIDILDIEHESVLESINDEVRSAVDPEDCFIDPVMAAEIKKYRIACEQNKIDKLVETKKDELNNLDYTQEGLYTIAFEEEMSYLAYDLNNDVMLKVFDNSYAVSGSKLKIQSQINVKEEEVGGYSVIDYKSSHIGMTK